MLWASSPGVIEIVLTLLIEIVAFYMGLFVIEV